MEHPPGTVWSYTAIEAVIIAEITRNAAKMLVMDFVKNTFFSRCRLTMEEEVLFASGNAKAKKHSISWSNTSFPLSKPKLNSTYFKLSFIKKSVCSSSPNLKIWVPN